jgi:hypothetical protein
VRQTKDTLEKNAMNGYKYGDHFAFDSKELIMDYDKALVAASLAGQGFIIDDSKVVNEQLVRDIVLPSFYSQFSMAERIQLV